MGVSGFLDYFALQPRVQGFSLFGARAGKMAIRVPASAWCPLTGNAMELWSPVPWPSPESLVPCSPGTL